MIRWSLQWSWFPSMTQSWLTVQDCPDLVDIHDLKAGGVSLITVPRLRVEVTWVEGRVLHHFKGGV